MDAIKINVAVTADEALKAGKTQHGEHKYQPSEEELASLSHEQREALVPYLDRYTMRLVRPEFTWASIVATIDIKLEQKRKEQEEDEAKRRQKKETCAKVLAYLLSTPDEQLLRTVKYTFWHQQAWREYQKTEIVDKMPDGTTISLWDTRDDEGIQKILSRLGMICETRNGETVQAIRDRVDAEIAAEQKEEARRMCENAKAIAALIADIGTESQKARYAEGLLPGEERGNLIRDHLFKALEKGWTRYRKIKPSDISHDDCDDEDNISFEVVGADSLTADEYDRLRKIRAQIDNVPGATVTALKHTGCCTNCSGSTAVKASAKVEILFAGQTYTREYELGIIRYVDR